MLLQEIRKQGYTGGVTILREVVRPLKQEMVRRVTERFETLPAQRAQIHWGECGTIEVGGERKRLYVFVMVLGYSRMTFARFTTSSKLPLGCLVRAFDAIATSGSCTNATRAATCPGSATVVSNHTDGNHPLFFSSRATAERRCATSAFTGLTMTAARRDTDERWSSECVPVTHTP